MRRESPPPRAMADLADIGLAVLLAAVLLTSSLSAVLASDLTGWWRSLVVAVLVVLHAAVGVRSRWPVGTFAVAAVVMLVLALAPDLAGEAAATVGSPFSALLLPSGLVFFVSLYTVSSQTAPPLPHLALGIGLIGGVITLGRLWNAGDYVTAPGTGLAAWRLFVTAAVVAGLVAAWALGRYRATRIAWVAALEERAVRAERERLAAVEQARLDLEHEAERAAAAERRRIAREMHDVVAHSLAVVVGQAEGGRMLVANEPGRATEVLSTIADQGRQALGEMRSLLGVLREDEAVSRGPQPGLDDLDRLVTEVRRAGTPVEVVEKGTRQPLPATADLAAFRVIQECLTNVVKHAGPGARATVTLDWSRQGLRVRVQDDGDVPVDPSEGPIGEYARGRGLLGMRERLALVGGELEEGRPAPSGGFVVVAWIPKQPERPETEGTTP